MTLLLCASSFEIPKNNTKKTSLIISKTERRSGIFLKGGGFNHMVEIALIAWLEKLPKYQKPKTAEAAFESRWHTVISPASHIPPALRAVIV